MESSFVPRWQNWVEAPPAIGITVLFARTGRGEGRTARSNRTSGGGLGKGDCAKRA